jgi:hypothetical protein
MSLFWTWCARPTAAAIGGLLLLAEPTSAQLGAPPPPAIDSNRNSPAYTMSADLHVVVHPDLTSTADNTIRFKILRESAIQSVSQRELSYVESIASPRPVSTRSTSATPRSGR